MCSRFITRNLAAAEREMRIGPGNTSKWLQDSYNVAPSQSVPVVRWTDGQREGAAMRWGLVPYWAEGVAQKFGAINAPVEIIASAAGYRGPWKRGRRCIVVASGFYEWHVREDGTKQPHFVRLKSRDVFGFAALWDSATTDKSMTVESCAIITMSASPFMAKIHNDQRRMPAILAKADHEAWLQGNPREALAAIKQYPDDALVAWPVSKAVNSPRSNGPELIEPLSP